MDITTFWMIVDNTLSFATMAFTAANEMIIIDDPEVSLFGMMVGFVVLELILTVINSLRGGGYSSGGFGGGNTGVDKPSKYSSKPVRLSERLK